MKDEERPDIPGEDCTRSYFPSDSPIAGAAAESLLRTVATWQLGRGRESHPIPDETPTGGHSPFVLGEVIGRGGMGEVFAAQQRSLRRIVAVKRIRPDRMGDSEPELQESRAEFIREALITGFLEHPNIIPVHDLGTDEEGNPLLAMKRVAGRGWNVELREDFAVLPVEDYLQKHLPILQQVALGVSYAHECGIVHRDLKPSQVMIGDFGEVLLVDWGLAIHWQASGGGQDAPGHLLDGLPTIETATNPSGTPALMAPEQTRRHALDIGPWTDVYLLGGTLYFLLTGTYPHEAQSSQLAMIRAANGIVEPPSARAPGRMIPTDLEALALHCLQPKPEDRPASVHEIIAGIRDHLTGANHRRESREITTEAAAMVAAWRSPGYPQFTEVLTALERAGNLWPRNEAITPLRERVLAQYAETALAAEDLTLARVQAERLLDPERRRALLAAVERAVLEHRRQRRQRRAALATAAALVLLVLGGGAFFILKLREEQANALRQQHIAEQQRSVAEKRVGGSQELVNFLLTDLAESLDLRSERDRTISTSVTGKVLEFVGALEMDADRPEVQLAHADFLDGLSRNLRLLGRAEDALPLSESSYRIHRKQAPDDLLGATDSLSQLAAALSSLGEVDEAAKLFEDVYRLRLEAHGPIHPDTIMAVHELAVIHQKRGDRAAALRLAEEQLALDYPREDPEFFRPMAAIHSLAGTQLHALGRGEEALDRFMVAISLFNRLEKKEAKAEIFARQMIALTLRSLSRHEEALDLFLELRDEQLRRSGPDAPILGATTDLARRSIKDGGLPPLDLEFYRDGISRADHPDPGRTAIYAEWMEDLTAVLNAHGEHTEVIERVEDLYRRWGEYHFRDIDAIWEFTGSYLRAVAALHGNEEAHRRAWKWIGTLRESQPEWSLVQVALAEHARTFAPELPLPLENGERIEYLEHAAVQAGVPLEFRMRALLRRCELVPRGELSEPLHDHLESLLRGLTSGPFMEEELSTMVGLIYLYRGIIADAAATPELRGRIQEKAAKLYRSRPEPPPEDAEYGFRGAFALLELLRETGDGTLLEPIVRMLVERGLLDEAALAEWLRDPAADLAPYRRKR